MQSVSTPVLSSVSSSTTLLSSVPVSLESTDNFDTRHTLGVVCNQVLSVAQVNYNVVDSINHLL